MAKRGLRRLTWPGLAALVALVPVVGAFSTTHVFYVRDLGVFFWPRHVWLKRSWAARDWPWWDPYAASGQSAVADALNQFFLLPATVLRLVTPDVVGFNLWIAAPFPLMAIGAWLWLRRHVSPAAACVGAAIYAVAGPVVSTGTFPNLSWAVALIPWTLWLADGVLQHRGVRRMAALAMCTAAQAVAGEPVTLAGTGVLVLAYAAAHGETGHGGTEARLRGLWRRVRHVAAALFIGALLSMVQMLPTMVAAARASRSETIDATIWSLHPLELVETVVAHLFGHADDGLPETMPWLGGLHDGREPFLTTLYIGLGALVLAMIGHRDRPTRRSRAFWWIAAAVALVAALGTYTPLYPALQDAVPFLRSFRYSIKYVVFCVVALAALAAHGADALLAHAQGRPSVRRPAVPLAAIAVVVSVSTILAVSTFARPDWVRRFWEVMAVVARLENPAGAAEWMAGRSVPLLLGVAALGSGLALLLAVAWTGHRGARLAAVALCGLAVADPLVVNRDLHPIMPASDIGPPAWLSGMPSHQADRVYVGGRVVRLLGPRAHRLARLDAPDTFSGDAEFPVQQGNVRLAAELAYYPAAWSLRESISFDLPQLWPREYTMMIQTFRRVSREDRFRYLQRTAVRYCYVSEPPHPGAARLTAPVASTGPMALYECQPDARRVYLTNEARVEPNLSRQIELMFDAGHDPYLNVLLEREPPAPAGQPGVGSLDPAARIVRESNTEVMVSASVGPGGGYLNLVDSYDPFWRVEVDGRPAPLLRANALYRAVRLAPGSHEVRFTYRPTPFYVGLAITLCTILGLAAMIVRERLARRSRVALMAAKAG